MDDSRCRATPDLDAAHGAGRTVVNQIDAAIRVTHLVTGRSEYPDDLIGRLA
jgi:hypothetical protein